MYKRFIYHAIISVFLVHFILLMVLLIINNKKEIPNALLYWQFILVLLIFPISAIYCFVRRKVEDKTNSKSKWLFIIGLSFPAQTLATAIFIQQIKIHLEKIIFQTDETIGIIDEKTHFLIIFVASVLLTCVMVLSDSIINWRNKKGLN